jgi:hypothetical protein
MRSFAPFLLSLFLATACAEADSTAPDAGASGEGGAPGAGQGGSAGATSGQGGSGMVCIPGQQLECACPGSQVTGAQVCDKEGKSLGPCTGCPGGAGGSGGTGGSGGKGGAAGKGGEGPAFGGAAGQSEGGNDPGGSGGTPEAGSGGNGGQVEPFGGSGGAVEPFGGSGGEAGQGGTGQAGSAQAGAGQAGEAGAGGEGGAGQGGSGAAPGWDCADSLYNTGGDKPACNCDCGAYDPDCDNPTSFMKGCDKGQTCGSDGTCQGPVLSTPSSWVCGSAYYAIGGPVPVCDCGCGAPDPDCDLYQPTYNLSKCGKGQTCGSDGKCQGPILEVPAAWTCKPSKFAEGSTSGTCDCDCGAPDPDCNDKNLDILGCGYKQTCGSDGKCQGAIAPAPAGWTCGDSTYSDGKLCHCENCGLRDPDCEQDDLPDDCGPDAFCASLKNECIPSAF